MTDSTGPAAETAPPSARRRRPRPAGRAGRRAGRRPRRGHPRLGRDGRLLRRPAPGHPGRRGRPPGRRGHARPGRRPGRRRRRRAHAGRRPGGHRHAPRRRGPGPAPGRVRRPQAGQGARPPAPDRGPRRGRAPGARRRGHLDHGRLGAHGGRGAARGRAPRSSPSPSSSTAGPWPARRCARPGWSTGTPSAWRTWGWAERRRGPAAPGRAATRRRRAEDDRRNVEDRYRGWSVEAIARRRRRPVPPVPRRGGEPRPRLQHRLDRPLGQRLRRPVGARRRPPALEPARGDGHRPVPRRPAPARRGGPAPLGLGRGARRSSAWTTCRARCRWRRSSCRSAACCSSAAEGPGLSAEALAGCDVVVGISQFGSTRSVNVGAAAAVVMHAWVRRWVFDQQVGPGPRDGTDPLGP